ncbi:Mical family protein [Megaselia abdita]
MNRNKQQQLLLQQQQQQMADNEAAALAAEMFDLFCVATTMRQVLGLYRNMCDTIGLRPAPYNDFYPKLKQKVRSWKAQALWKKFDARASHRVYNKGTASTGTRVLVIGAGPCGLRTAIEAQLLGAKVVVVEKRDRISRNNVLHLWPFVITDLRNLGAKKFYGKFCAGSIDHISIRQLQCILLKVALLLGVEVHEGVSFIDTVEPSEGYGWRAAVEPENHAVSHYEFDVLIGADGKRNTLEGFKRKEFRGKLAIAITANFINKKTEAEAKAEEISGVAFIFNQSFFKELYQTTGIDLENIVYYKDETHYFVMTAKKHSLIDKGVILQDYGDPAELLAKPNVNTEKLLDYAREAAEFSTKYQMPNLEFAVNHYGKPDVAMFDFTSMFQAETSCRVSVRNNYRLMQCLVGDSLLEPFWPTGSGCARGFLSSMDAAYAIKLWSNPKNSVLGVLAQRESIYRLLAQTTPENLQRDTGAYTVDPATRYPNLNRQSVNVWQVKHLIDSDDKAILEQTHMDVNALQQMNAPELTPIRRKRRTGDTLPLSTVLLRWVKAQLHSYDFTQQLNEVSDCFLNGQVLCALIYRYRPDLVDFNAVKELSKLECNDLAFKILERDLKIPRVMTAKDSLSLDSIDSKIWLNYLEQICEVFRGEIPHVKHPKLEIAELKDKTPKAMDFSKLLKFTAKKAKSPLQDVVEEGKTVHRKSILDDDKVKKMRRDRENNQGSHNDTPRRAKKRRSAEKSANIDRERGIPSALPRGADEQFSDRIKDMEQRITSRSPLRSDKKPKDLMRAIGKIDSSDWNVKEIEKKIQLSKKTETGSGKGREKVPKWDKEQFRARQNRITNPDQTDSNDEKFKEIDQTIKNLDKQLKEGKNLEVGERGRNKVASIAGQFKKKDDTSEEKNPPATPKTTTKVPHVLKKQSSEKCHFCKQTVYMMEKIFTEGLTLHRSCLKCHHCHTNLRAGAYAFDRDDPNGRFYCTQHFRLPAKPSRPVVRKGQKTTVAKMVEKPTPATEFVTPEKPKGRTESVAQLELLDRGQTPERIEFENADAMSDGEPSLENIIDENEWTDRNFITSSEESESDLSSSGDSDDESDEYEEANESPIGAQTLQLANDWIGKQRYSKYSDDSDNDFYDSSEDLLDDDGDDSQTEGEELKKAREMRREEVRLMPIPGNIPTDTETEVQTDSDSSSGEILNSATEISTDSEFDHDPVFARRAAPKIFIDDTHLRKHPTKVQIKQGVIGTPSEKTSNVHHNNNNIHHLNKNNNTIKDPKFEFKPLVQVDPSVLSSTRDPTKNIRTGYELNKTASTEGIASKKSLELKKRYLLGGENSDGNKIMKSGSTSILDTKLRSFHSNISECQKLLNAKPLSPPITARNETVNTVLLESLKRSPSLNSTAHLETIEIINKPNKTLSDSKDELKVGLYDNDVIDLTLDSPAKSDKTIVAPDISIVKEVIPDIISQVKVESADDIRETSIAVPSHLTWKTDKDGLHSTTETSSSSSMEDIHHYILQSTTTTTSPSEQIVPRLEIRDTSGELMQIDSLMIVNGEYIGDPDDLKNLEIPEGLKIPEKTIEHEPLIPKEEDVPPPQPLADRKLPLKLDLKEIIKPEPLSDKDKTPTVEKIPTPGRNSDSENEDITAGGTITGCQTETELSDWTVDDAISENFVDIEFVLNSNKGTIKRNKGKKRSGLFRDSQSPSPPPVPPPPTNIDCGILMNLDIDELEFMDTGSEDGSIHESINKVILKNKGYVEFVENTPESQYIPLKMQARVNPITPTRQPSLPKEIPGIDYIEQGAYILQNDYDLKTPVNEIPPALTKSLDEEETVLTATATPTTTEESEALTMVTSSDTVPVAIARIASQEDILSPSVSSQKPESDEITYEEYVRSLQQKITEISNARDSLEQRKQQKRKLSKGTNDDVFPISQSSSVAQSPSKVPEIPSLSKKLEEISKERTKQKDLIHDLVMDKLQSKKQLNAEKRLNRSRNRQSLIQSASGSAIGGPVGCLNAPHTHCHPTSISPCKTLTPTSASPSTSSSKENHPQNVQLKQENVRKTYAQRPFSEILNSNTNYAVQYVSQEENPLAHSSSTNTLASTEKMRADARARARLKSNQELGLSPEEKQQLRKRYHVELQDLVTKSQIAKGGSTTQLAMNNRQLNTSKSVNDISLAAFKLPNSARKSEDFTSDPNLLSNDEKVAQKNPIPQSKSEKIKERRQKDPDRRKSLIQTVSSFFSKNKKDKSSAETSTSTSTTPTSSPPKNKEQPTSQMVTSTSHDGVATRFRTSGNGNMKPACKEKSKDSNDKNTNKLTKRQPQPLQIHHQQLLQHSHHYHPSNYERSISHDNLSHKYEISAYASTPQLFKNANNDDQAPPPIPPLPLHYQRSDDESGFEPREFKKQRAVSKASRQAELKRLRIAQEIQREQEEIEVELKDLEARGVYIEKKIRGEMEEGADSNLACDEKLLKELFDIWASITNLKKRDEELTIRQHELKLEHRHAQLKDELNMRLSSGKLEKSSTDVAAEGAILNEMLEIVAKRAALRPSFTSEDISLTKARKSHETESQI